MAVWRICIIQIVSQTWLSLTAWRSVHWSPLVWFFVHKKPKSNLYIVIITWNTADSIISHAQKATALLPIVFFKGNTSVTVHTQGNVGLSVVQTTAKVNCKFFSQYQYFHLASKLRMSGGISTPRTCHHGVDRDSFYFVVWKWVGTFSENVQFQYNIFPKSCGRCGVNFFRLGYFALCSRIQPFVYCSNTEITGFQSTME